jgi:hypothetical protein
MADPLKIYISSTFSDLEPYREAVYKALRKLRHDVVAMEDYVATDKRPLDKCLADVESCDVYVGIFAWRYGYVPKKDNPQKQSITEREFRRAVEKDKQCLIFLMADEAPWLVMAALSSPALMTAPSRSGISVPAKSSPRLQRNLRFCVARSRRMEERLWQATSRAACIF